MGVQEAMATFVAEACQDGRCEKCHHSACTHACHQGGPKFQLFPELPAGDYKALKDDIAKRGVLVPVEFDEEGNVLDGHHRARACAELGITDYPKVIRHEMSPAEKRSHIRALNLHRRHLDQEQRRQVIAAELREFPKRSNRQTARKLGVDHKTVRKVRDEAEATGDIPQLDRTIGADGKSRPAHREPSGGDPEIGDDSAGPPDPETVPTGEPPAEFPLGYDPERTARVLEEQTAELERQEQRRLAESVPPDAAPERLFWVVHTTITYVIEAPDSDSAGELAIRSIDPSENLSPAERSLIIDGLDGRIEAPVVRLEPGEGELAS